MTDAGPGESGVPPAGPDGPVSPAERPPAEEPPPTPPLKSQGKPHDRWAHRRGEPRVFALLWTIYLMAATALALGAVGARGQIPVEVYRPIAQILLVTVAAGVVLVWPLVRLSQARPATGAAWAAMTDYFVVLLPVQAIVWPQIWLTGWPLVVIAGLAAMLASWGLLVAGFLAWALAGGENGPRINGPWIWMGVVIGLVGLGPLAASISGLVSGPGGPTGLASPLTAIHTLTAGVPVGGVGTSVTGEQWSMMLAPGGAGLAVWLGAWLREVWRGFRGAGSMS
jgi:hypothetical protein